MSHSEEKEPNPEEEDREAPVAEEVSEAEELSEEEQALEGEVTSEGADVPEESSSEEEAPPAALDAGMVADPRFSRLMKMQSRFVTEETLRSTEEKSKPKTPEPEEIDDPEIYDEEYDEELEDDEDYHDDFEDDDYEDDELEPIEDSEEASSETPDEESAEDKPEAEPAPPEEDTDHRLANLRKLNTTFVTEKDLEVSAKKSDEPEVYKETKVELVICPNCQSEEPRSGKMCGKCGAKLPKLVVSEEKYNPGTLNVAVLKYFDAVKNLQSKKWDAEEFNDFLLERIAISEAHIDGLHELMEESGSQEWLPKATQLIKESTLLLEDAITAMLDKVEETRAEQAYLDAEFDQLLADYEDLADDEELDEIPEPPEAPLPVDERIRMLDFKEDLESIKKANGMMLNTLKLIDEFQKRANDDLNVSF